MYKLIKEYDNLPPTKQVAERLITIVAQYFCPHISYSSINAWLDDIVQKVLIQLEREHPEHLIFATSSEQFSVWRENNINDLFWDLTEGRQIISAMTRLLSDEFLLCELQQLFLLVNLNTEERSYVVSYYKLSLILIIIYYLFQENINAFLNICIL